MTLSYIQATGDTSANTDAGDQYTGLDRVGRVIDQVWRNSSGSVIDRYQYGYDRSGNRVSKNNLVDSALSEVWSAPPPKAFYQNFSAASCQRAPLRIVSVHHSDGHIIVAHLSIENS